MKVKKKFLYDGVELRIVEREETYANATVVVTAVLAPNGGTVPVIVGRKQTLKNIITETISTLDALKAKGIDVITPLITPIIK